MKVIEFEDNTLVCSLCWELQHQGDWEFIHYTGNFTWFLCPDHEAKIRADRSSSYYIGGCY